MIGRPGGRLRTERRSTSAIGSLSITPALFTRLSRQMEERSSDYVPWQQIRQSSCRVTPSCSLRQHSWLLLEDILDLSKRVRGKDVSEP